MPTAEELSRLTLARQIDGLCDRFEKQWLAGEQPRLEEYVGALPPSLHPLLLAALLPVELELIRRLGGEPSDQTYRRRFPEHSATVSEVFAALSARKSGETSVQQESARTGPLEQKPAPLPLLEAEPLATRIGRFQVIALLGEGAFGRVYKARDPQLNRDVAIKVPFNTAVATELDRERFLREARAAAGIHHPNVCPVHEVGEADGKPYIVMALIPGQSLAATLKSRKEPLPDKQAAVIVRKLALALDVAHKGCVVHRDLKPANIMFDRERKDVVITDFGLARGPRLSDVQATQSGVIMGTPAYMSPEQARGDSKAVGPAADIYSLGIILYELLCGRRPYSGSVTEIIGQILHVEPDPPSRHRSGIDRRLEAACMKAIAKDPADRFESMKDLAAAMDAVLRTPAGPATETAKATNTKADADSSIGTDTRRLADLFAVHASEQKKATEAAVEKAVRKARTPRWVFVVAGIILIGGLTALGAIIFYTGNDKVRVTVEIRDFVDLSDKTLTFFLDEKPISAEAFANPIELKPGDHILVVKRRDKIINRLLLTVTGGRSPGIKVRDITPKQENDPELTPEQEDRRFAQWLFSIGIKSVTVSVDGGPQKGIGSVAGLPEGPFRVWSYDSWGNNRITDTNIDPILQWIERRHPNKVDFFGTGVGDATVRRLVKFPFIKHVGLGATRLTPACIPALATRTDLLTLTLSERPIGDADLEKLSNLKSLEIFNLNSTRVSDAGLKHLRGMKKLRSLVLHQTAVSGKGLEELAGLPIENLGLISTGVRGTEGLAPLKKLPELKEVSLCGLLLGDDDLKPLIECKSVERLSLQDNRITDRGLDELAKMTWLKSLTIRHAGGSNPVTPAGVDRFKKALPNCHVVYEGDLDQAADSTKVDLEKWQGTWKCVGEKSRAMAWTAEELKAAGKVMEVTGNRLVIERTLGGTLGRYSGTFKLDPSKTPRHFDWEGTGPAGANICLSGVYEFTGERLRFIYRNFPIDQTQPRAGWNDERTPSVVWLEFERVIAEDGFVSLFNGKDLTGWKAVGTPKWSWAEGRLLGSPTPDRGAGMLMTEADYENFELELEYRLAEGAGSGLLLRTDPNTPETGKGQMEVQIADDEAFKLVPINATGSVWNVFPRKVAPLNVLGKWNALRVRLIDRRIEIWVNGAQTVDADLDTARAKFADVPGLNRKTGRIALQQDQKADVEFRNVRIKGIKPVQPIPPQPHNLDADRKAAESLLSLGNGFVKVNGEERQIRRVEGLPAAPFRLTGVYFADVKKLDDDALACLKDCVHLTELDLRSTRVTEKGLEIFRGKTNFTSLGLAYLRVSDKGLEIFKDNKKLRALFIHDTYVTDKGLSLFHGCKELDTVWVGGTPISDAGMLPFRECKFLKWLDVRATKVSRDGVQAMKAALPACRVDADPGKR